MDQTNNNQPNQTPPTEEKTETPVASTPPIHPTTEPAPPSDPNTVHAQAGIPTPAPVTPPAQTKKSPLPLIIGAVIVLLLAAGAAYYIYFMDNKAPTAQAPVAQVKTQPKASSDSSQTTKEIEAADSDASDSSDLQSVQTDINKL